MNKTKSLGQCAYEAYAEHRNGLAFNGDPVPIWEEVDPDIKVGWEKAADAVIENQSKY